MDNLANADAVFSIANIVETGLLKYMMTPGDWYGPSRMIQIFEHLNIKYNPFKDLNIISFPKGVIYIETIQKKLQKDSNSLIILMHSH